MKYTLTSKVFIDRTDRRNRVQIIEGRGVYTDLENHNQGTVTLDRGDSWTLTFSKLLYCNFPEKTLIRITIGSTVNNNVEVKGSMLLPFAGTVYVENPSANVVTTPIVFNYVLG